MSSGVRSRTTVFHADICSALMSRRAADDRNSTRGNLSGDQRIENPTRHLEVQEENSRGPVRFIEPKCSVVR